LLTAKRLAASPVDIPPLIAATTRFRRSVLYGLPIKPPVTEGVQKSAFAAKGNPIPTRIIENVL
jgi:hypothetical protein